MPSDEEIYKWVKKGSLVVLGLTLLLLLISFGSPHWATTNHLATRQDHIGLWKFCTTGVKPGGGHIEHCTDFIDIVTHDWQKATQAFMTLAVFGCLVTLAGFATYIFVPDYQQEVKVFIGCCAAAFVTVLLISIACASFLTKYRDWFLKYDTALPPDAASLGWAFWMAVVVGLMLLAAPGMLVPDTYVNTRAEAKPARDPRRPYDF